MDPILLPSYKNCVQGNNLFKLYIAGFNCATSIPNVLCTQCIVGGGGGMIFNATFNNNSVISWQLVLLVEETRVHGENHRPVASH